MTVSSHIDNPSTNDNRNYDYSRHREMDRYEYPVIVDMVKPNSTVVDLGCGNGSLLLRLKNEKNIIGTGLEISESGITACKEHNLDVQFGRIDEQLSFKDNQFDYAICNVTMQMVLYPEVLLKEMKRIARYQIISFPNFAFWRNRIDLLINGRMPRPMLFGYSWYATGHIHQFSFEDFHQLLNDVGGLSVIEQRLEGSKNPIKNYLMHHYPNLFQHVPVYLLKKQ